MRPFHYVEGSVIDTATRVLSGAPAGAFLAGGTTLVDLMKIDVMRPDILVGLGKLPLGLVEAYEGGVRVGATVRNSHLAAHPLIRERYPVLSEALLSGASAQLRNMATTAGNILQRTRCPYFRDVNAACNKRQPGTGCDALGGFDRSHAVLGTSRHCIAAHPSDMCVALALLDTVVGTRKADGSTRSIPFSALHLLPGDTPARETVLEHGELITHIDIPASPLAEWSHYLKVRDRSSYEFALASAAVALDIEGGVIREARIALGGVATKPWRASAAERLLSGQQPTPASFRAAAAAALDGAVAGTHNGFKIELAKRTVAQALQELLARMSSEDEHASGKRQPDRRTNQPH